MYQPQEWASEVSINIRKQQLAIISFDIESRCNFVTTLPYLFVIKILIDIIYFRANYKNRILNTSEDSEDYL